MEHRLLKLIRKRMADYLTRAFCLLALIFGQPASNVFANINFDEYRESREAALSQIKSGKTKLGLIGLVKLSEKGDGVSSHTLGLFYLKAHQVVRPDVDKAVRLFALGASQCYVPSLRVLESNFYGNKASKYYDLSKLAVANASCKKKQQLKAEAENKKAEEQRKAEAKRKEAEERRKAETKREEIEKKNQDNSPELDGLIDSEIIFAWSRVLPKFSKRAGMGSGFAVSDDGYFLTNHHVVVRDKCKKIAVNYNNLNGEGTTVAYSKELDLALVKVEAPTPYFGKFDITTLKAGERLVALGYPVEDFFGKKPTISEGTLTNTSDTETQLRDDGFLFVSVPITQGNSGGPIMSSNVGIRGIASYGFKSDTVEKVYEESSGVSVNLASINLNFMVSGIRAYKWLEKNAKFINLYNSNELTMRANTQEIAEAGLQILAKIECFEE